MAEFTANGIDLRRADGSVWSWIRRGWVDEPAEHRGTDQAPPGRPGRFRPAGLTTRIADRRVVQVQTVVKATTAAGFLALVQSLKANVWNPALDPYAVVLGDGYRGLGAGQTATLTAQFVNVIPVAQQTEFWREYSWELESIANPPEWVIAP